MGEREREGQTGVKADRQAGAQTKCQKAREERREKIKIERPNRGKKEEESEESASVDAHKKESTKQKQRKRKDCAECICKMHTRPSR